MIQISQKEAEYIRKHNRDFDVHMSSKTHKGNAKRYYLTTSDQSLYLLKEYRESVHQYD